MASAQCTKGPLRALAAVALPLPPAALPWAAVRDTLPLPLQGRSGGGLVPPRRLRRKAHLRKQIKKYKTKEKGANYIAWELDTSVDLKVALERLCYGKVNTRCAVALLLFLLDLL